MVNPADAGINQAAPNHRHIAEVVAKAPMAAPRLREDTAAAAVTPALDPLVVAVDSAVVVVAPLGVPEAAVVAVVGAAARIAAIAEMTQIPRLET